MLSLNNNSCINLNMGLTKLILLEKKKIGKKNVYLYNTFFYYYIQLPPHFIFYPQTNYIYIHNLNNFSNKNEIEKFFNFFFKTWILIFFQKIKFTGKGYKLRRKNNAIKFYFGRSHITIIWFKNFIFKKYGKNKIILISETKQTLRLLYLYINRIRKINIFTKRGLRFIRQKIKKKTGKKSSYM